MKKIDWFFSFLLMITGLTCLLFSARAFGHASLRTFGKMFANVCMWVACPLVIVGGLYIWSRFRK
ncbi:MAG: hypothetical protein LKI80_06645 [Sporolactobacillus sp.]|jgi:hypothetical protein|nr:hypothetical protein [Sporolactobacillus sp.]